MKLIPQSLRLAFSAKARQKVIEDQANAIAKKVLAQYEAGQRWNPRRSYVPGWVRDARFDADSATRLEIVRKSRYFERNNGIVNKLFDLFEQYTVGPNGLQFIPSSSDKKWNANMRSYWNDWGQYPDKTSLQSYGTLCSLSARSWAENGEVFILKTRGKPREGGRSYPRVQLIEGHRVATPGQDFGSANVIDGIRVDANGRPETYYVRMGTENEETFDPIPADQIVHIFEPTRPGMYRGLPLLYPVLNDLHDLDDLQIGAMDIAKDAANVGRVIETENGELPEEDFLQRRLRSDLAERGTSGGSDLERDKYYEEVFGAETKVLKRGDTMKQMQVERPAESERMFWDYKTSVICAGFGVSKLLVFPWSMQGTVTRADLDVMAQFFKSRSGVLAAGWKDIFYYVAGFGIAQEKSLASPPGDWRNVKVRAPRSVNVDVGRNATALINEYLAGFRTLESICSELGEDYVEVLEQQGLEMEIAAEIEQRRGLAPGTLINKTLDALKANLEREALEVQRANQQNQDQYATA